MFKDLKISKKQSLILCPGLPRSGTTSLWHMLREAKIFDIPWKEPHFLSVLSDDKTDLPTFFPKEFKNRYHQYVYDLNREYININPPYTLDVYKKYIEKEPEIRIKKRAPKRPSSTNKRSLS